MKASTMKHRKSKHASNQRLSDREVLELRRLWASGVNTTLLHAAYPKVSRTQIWYAVTGRTYRWVPMFQRKGMVAA